MYPFQTINSQKIGSSSSEGLCYLMEKNREDIKSRIRGTVLKFEGDWPWFLQEILLGQKA